MKSSVELRVLFVILSLSIASPLLSQSLFSRSVSNDVHKFVSDVMVVDNDKRLFITARSSDNIFSNSDSSFILKSDMDGNIIFQYKEKQLLDFQIKPLVLSGMVQLDTTFLVAGFVNSGKKPLLLIHYSRSGILLGYKAFHYPFLHNHGTYAPPQFIILTDDNHVVISRFEEHGWFGHDRIKLLRTTIDGSASQLITLTSNKDQFPVKLLAMNNGKGEYIMATYAGDYIPPAPPHDNFPRLFRFDSAGNYLWVKDFMLSYNVTLTDIIQLSDQGYVMVGNGLKKSYIFKTNSEFEVQWMKSSEFPDTTAAGPFPAFYGVVEKEDNNLIIAGSQRLNNSDGYSLLIETDPQGNLVDSRIDSFGNSFNRIAGMPDSFILLVGRDQYDHLCFSSIDSISSYACELADVGINWYDDSMPVVVDQFMNSAVVPIEPIDTFSFLRFDQFDDIYDGCLGIAINVEEVIPANDFSIFPNPASETINLNGTLPGLQSVTIRIIDLAGRVLLSHNEGDIPGSLSKQIDVTGISSGTYLLQIVYDSHTSVQKLIIER